MSATYWTPRPKPGDIVECRFPQQVGVPGPKDRPALVLQVEEAADDPAGSVVVVAYATSQNTTAVYPGEFVIDASAKTGLTKATKFDLVNCGARTSAIVNRLTTTLPVADHRWFRLLQSGQYRQQAVHDTASTDTY